MKVLLIGDYPPPHGGVAVHVEQLHSFFQSRGIESRVLDIGKGGRPAPDVLPVRSPTRLLAELVRAAASGFTLHLHTSGNNPKAWALIALVGQVAAPRVVTLHSGLLPGFLGRSRLRQRLARAALAGYDRVVAVSTGVRDALVEADVSSERIEVYPAFCASQVIPGRPPEGFEAIRARRAPLLAMQHHPSPVYGRELMFQALAELRGRFPDVGLAVYGSGTDQWDFLASARLAGVEGLIEDLGELEHGQALAVLQRCDAFVRPTTADGDSISVREALTLGVPCVASDVCPRPEGTLAFRAGDAAALADRVVTALVHRPLPGSAPDAGPRLLELYPRLRNRRPAQLAPAQL